MKDRYKLTNHTKEVFGHTLHQIKALKDFGDVKRGDLGGWIENYYNLSKTGTAWVYDNAEVWGNAKVCSNARVYGNAHVYDNAEVFSDAEVSGNALVYDNAVVCDRAIVCGNAQVYDNACVYGDSKVWGNAQVYNRAVVYDKAQVHDNAQVYNYACVYGYVTVSENAKVYGDSKVHENIYIRENDEIKGNKSCLIFDNTWSSDSSRRQFVYVLSNHRWHIGCFDGTGKELIKKAYQDSELSGKMYELYVHIAKQVIETQQQLEEM